MIRFWGLVFLPIVWMALTGGFYLANFFLGLALSSLALWFSHPGKESAPLVYYLDKGRRWILFIVFFAWELTLASLRIVWDILTPRHRMRPAIVAIPLELTSDIQITTLANLITLTPGTLSLDVSADRRVLYVHAMYVGDIEDFRRDIKERLERRVMELFQ